VNFCQREQVQPNFFWITTTYNAKQGGMLLTCVERYVNSQSSMNSQRCARPPSLASGISLMRIRIESTIAFLYSNPPSSLKILLRKLILQIEHIHSLIYFKR
jgi:hypothetical protein